MKILLVGGHPWMVRGLQSGLESNGASVWCCGVDYRSAFTPSVSAFQEFLRQGKNRSGESFDIIQFNQPCSVATYDSSAFSELAALLGALKTEGSKLVLSCSSPVPFFHEYGAFYQLMDALIVSYPACAYLSEHFPNSAQSLWPIEAQEAPSQVIEKRSGDPIHALHIPIGEYSRDTGVISEVLYQYQSKDRRLQFKIIRPEEFDTDLSLENAVDACDIYIEQVSASCTGDLGLLALSRGKTVLSGNSSELQMDWPATKFSPVLHTDAKTLYSRLQAIVREPRCLRDFGKRSREFIRNQHRPDSIGKLLIDYYGSLAAKNAQNQAYLELLL